MKLGNLLFFLFVSVIVMSSPAMALDPEKVPVAPELAALYADFRPADIFQATDGVYVARGYNRDNPVLIEGTDGLIVIDPGESIPAAETVKSAFNERLNNIFERKPVKAIIYTHHHDCHIHGASVFAGADTEIIAHENLEPILFYDWFSQVYPSRHVGGAYMSGALFADDSDWYAGCGLFAVQISGPSGHLPPTKTVHDKLETTIAGVNLILYSAPGETRDVLVIWLPDKKTLVQIANLYQSFPAITTLRGAVPRDPLSYVSSIDLYRSLNPECLVLIHGPNPVIVGKENISSIFTNYRDAMQFVHDQTVQNMNKGLTPGEIKEVVTLPPHLAADPFLQETYGQLDRNIYEIFWWYRGYFSGKCRDLFPQSPKQEALMAAELAGGVDQLADKAWSVLQNGKLEWALVLADDVLLLDPENNLARETKRSAMISIAEGTINAQTRNYILSEYLLETKPKQKVLPSNGHPRVALANMDDHMVSLMPMEALLRIMAVSLNASKSLNQDIVVGLHLNELTNTTDSADYTLHVRRGIEEVQAQTANNPGFSVTAKSLAWKNVVLGKVNPEQAVFDGDVVITGADPQEFYSFLALFDISTLLITYSPQKPLLNETVTFDSSASVTPDLGVLSWEWDFGDGSTATGKATTHAYSSVGNYTVKLTITDEGVDKRSASTIVQVLPLHR
jgi:alkyl sulfatase BDS1-like metallo-beta-lactamase superfamily hydrolase